MLLALEKSRDGKTATLRTFSPSGMLSGVNDNACFFTNMVLKSLSVRYNSSGLTGRYASISAALLTLNASRRAW